MCGINGIVNLNGAAVDANLIQRLNRVIAHRGPDDNGIWIEGSIGLGHQRLSIIDLSEKGKQPMCFDDLVISYNGEVFNFLEIRAYLIKQGYEFRSDSDTEVILKAYDHWGIDFVQQLNGMFAFCLVDQAKQKLFLVRDRFGIKPIYYYVDQERFLFSSEMKTLKQVLPVELHINKKAIAAYLNYLYIPNPTTIYEEIHKIRPGHYLEIDLKNHKISNTPYWNLETGPYESSKAEDLRDIEALLIDAIEKRMISDVPVGAFLSGGVDSSLICAIAARELGKPLHTFSIGYGKEGAFFDETEYAKSVAKKYSLEHHSFEVNIKDIFEDFDSIIYHMDEPNADTSVFLNYYISKFTRQQVTVALSGLGGDELFGGYNRYQAFKASEYLRLIPRGILQLSSSTLDKLPAGRHSSFSNLIRSSSKLITSIGINPEETYHNLISYSTNRPPIQIPYDKDLNHILKFDIESYMVDDLLELTDRMSMAHALEIRTPFLDYRLVQRAFQIPAYRKTTLFSKKILLKKLAEKYLDKSIIYRRKQGFSAPIAAWLQQQKPETLIRQFRNTHLLSFVPESYVLNVITAYYQKRKDFSLQLYALYILNTWLEKEEFQIQAPTRPLI